MEEEYIIEYLRVALNLLRVNEGNDLEEGFMEKLSPNYWEAIEENMLEQGILYSTNDGPFLDSVGKLKRQIISHFIKLDDVRNTKIDRAFNWSQPGITALLSSL